MEQDIKADHHLITQDGKTLGTLVKEDNVPCLRSQRWLLAFIGFFGFVFLYAVRINMSVAIVCMVRTTTPNITISFNKTEDDACVDETHINPVVNEHAEFDWSKTLRSSILASFFYGYIVTQIPAGWLADRFGGRRVFGIAMLISGICTVLTPVCARTTYILVIVLRVIIGLTTAVSFPAVNSMWGRWAPPLERSKLSTVSYSGTMFGNIATLSGSGLLCQYGFDNGWGSIFYVTGILTLIWVACWFFLTSDSPSQSRRITEAERNHILSLIEYNTDVRTSYVPWKAIFTSSAVWATLTAHVCNNWTAYTLLTSLPAFMKEVLKFDIKQNGAISSIPYICKIVSAFCAGFSADYIRSSGILSTVRTRKVYQSISFLGMASCLIVTGYSTCNTRVMAVVSLSLAVLFNGMGRAGYTCNHIDIAPKYGGIMFGITNTMATIPGMVAPILAGALTPNNTAGEWRSVFFVCAAVAIFGALVFGIFSKGEVEPWARDKKTSYEVTVDDKLLEKKLDIK